MTDLNPELIEKAAIATYEEMQHPNWRAPLWDEIDEPGRERFLNAARAAIEAVLPDIIQQAWNGPNVSASAGTHAPTVRHRDAITGQYTTADEADNRPDTTIRETRKP